MAVKLLGLGMRVITVDHDPTAEKLAKDIFESIEKALVIPNVLMDYVTVYENENSKATYSLE